MVRIKGVIVVEGYRVLLEFTDGSQRTVDLEQYLHGPIFEDIRRDPAVFRSVAVHPRFGTIVWPNGADIDPDVLYQGLTPARMEQQVP